jgi:hypothetical protein
MPYSLCLGSCLHPLLLQLRRAALVFTLQQEFCLAGLEGGGVGGGGARSFFASGQAPDVLPTMAEARELTPPGLPGPQQPSQQRQAKENCDGEGSRGCAPPSRHLRLWALTYS